MAERANLAIGVQPELAGDRSAHEIRRDIAATRDSIKDTVDRLNDRVEMALDWRTYVAHSPFVALGVAAGFGFLLTRMFQPQPSARERFVDLLVDSVEDFSGQVRRRLDHVPSEGTGAARAIKAAVSTIATQAVVAYVKDRYMGPPGSTSSAVVKSNGSRGGNE
jgi:hypothetical protein